MDPRALIAYLSDTLSMSPEQASVFAKRLWEEPRPLTENQARTREANAYEVNKYEQQALSYNPNNIIKPPEASLADIGQNLYDENTVEEMDNRMPDTNPHRYNWPKPAPGVKTYISLPDIDPALYTTTGI